MPESGCKGYWSGFDPRDFDCEYEFAGHINCEDCLFGACGGTKDPRIDPESYIEPVGKGFKHGNV